MQADLISDRIKTSEAVCGVSAPCWGHPGEYTPMCCLYTFTPMLLLYNLVIVAYVYSAVKSFSTGQKKVRYQVKGRERRKESTREGGRDCFGWAAVSHEERHAVTICYSRWTWYPGNCIKAAGAFAIESRGLFKQRSQTEQCSYHLSAGKITWPCRAELSFWRLHREFIQTLFCLGKTLAQGVCGETLACLFHSDLQQRESVSTFKAPGQVLHTNEEKLKQTDRRMKHRTEVISVVFKIDSYRSFRFSQKFNTKHYQRPLRAFQLGSAFKSLHKTLQTARNSHTSTWQMHTVQGHFSSDACRAHVWVKHESSHRELLCAAGLCQQGNEPKVTKTHGNLPAWNQTPAIITVHVIHAGPAAFLFLPSASWWMYIGRRTRMWSEKSLSVKNYSVI